MKVFISYSREDKAIAGNLYAQMEEHGIDAFLAHETIEVAADWKQRILHELSVVEAMFVLLSKKCKESGWTGHEVGYFYAKSEHHGPIIPISLDETISYGMFGHIQSQRIPAGAKAVPLELWLSPIVQAFPLHLLPVVINKLAECNWCRTSEAYMRILQPHFSTMVQANLDELMAVAVANSCIYSARECRTDLLPELVQVNCARLSGGQIALLQAKLDADESFTSRIVLPSGNS